MIRDRQRDGSRDGSCKTFQWAAVDVSRSHFWCKMLVCIQAWNGLKSQPSLHLIELPSWKVGPCSIFERCTEHVLLEWCKPRKKKKKKGKGRIAVDKISDRYLDSFFFFFSILFFFFLLLYRIISLAQSGEIVWPLAEPSALLYEPAAAAVTLQLTSFHSFTAGKKNKKNPNKQQKQSETIST